MLLAKFTECLIFAALNKTTEATSDGITLTENARRRSKAQSDCKVVQSYKIIELFHHS